MLRKFLLHCIVLLPNFRTVAPQLKPKSVQLFFNNEADVPLSLCWLNLYSGNALVPQKDQSILPKQGMNIDSYIGHSFVAFRDDMNLKSFNPRDKKYEGMDVIYFTMSPYDETVSVSRAENGTLIHTKTNSYTQTTDLMMSAAKKCEYITTHKIPSDGVECMANNLAREIAQKDRAASKRRNMHNAVGERLRNYTCADATLESTDKYIKEFQWEDKQVHVFLEEPAARIMLIEDFISDDECNALADASRGKMRTATVNGVNGADYSEARRAKAGPAVPNHSLPDGVDSVTDLYRRGYRFANHITGYNLSVEHQEHFSVIKYDPTDEYLTHCDGDCTGTPLRTGGRVCTMVIYCAAAEVGGGTTFSNADVYIKGKRGQAAFFSYYDAEKGITDDGLTKHSGCPVIKGEKFIATLWMRAGVTAEENHLHYDPEGRPIRSSYNPMESTSKDGNVEVLSAKEEL